MHKKITKTRHLLAEVDNFYKPNKALGAVVDNWKTSAELACKYGNLSQ